MVPGGSLIKIVLRIAGRMPYRDGVSDVQPSIADGETENYNDRTVLLQPYPFQFYWLDDEHKVENNRIVESEWNFSQVEPIGIK